MKAKRNLFYLCIMMYLMSCKPVPVSHWFPVTPHEEYEKELYKSGTGKTLSGQTWLKNALDVMEDSLYASAPYQERFHLGDSTTAQSIRLKILEGRSLEITTLRNPNDSLSHLFVELYRIRTNKRPQRLEYLKHGSDVLSYTNNGQDTLLLRLQTGVQEQLIVTLSITTLPTMAFPVASHGMQDVISVWGAERDRGIRAHEGIDIKARRGTPVIASANGIITNAGINKLGGKVVFQSVAESPYSLYYAHLDSQMVMAGARVITGDTLGLVGNTGNAVTTTPHLHFGIYTSNNGAVNPLPFLNDRKEKIPGLPQLSKWLGDSVRTRKKTVLFITPSLEKNSQISTIPINTTLQVLGEVSKGYRVKLADGTTGYIPTTPFRK